MRNHPGCLCLYATVTLSRDSDLWHLSVAEIRGSASSDGCHVPVSCDGTLVTVPPVPSLNRSYATPATFLSMACVLKRFPRTSPRKLALPCVKRGFLRTADPHRTSQLSPCSPQASQCHVYVMSGRDVACQTPSPRMPHTFGPLPRACAWLAISQVFDHYQHLANSVVVVYISFRKFLLSLKM